MYMCARPFWGPVESLWLIRICLVSVWEPDEESETLQDIVFGLQILNYPSLVLTKCLNMDDKLPYSNSDAVLQTNLRQVRALLIIQHTCVSFLPVLHCGARLTEYSLI